MTWSDTWLGWCSGTFRSYLSRWGSGRREAADALALIENLPGSEQHRCGFSPGWSVRAYEESLDLALFEAAFCFRCHKVRMHGTAVPPALASQFFDADTPPAQDLLALFRAEAP